MISAGVDYTCDYELDNPDVMPLSVRRLDMIFARATSDVVSKHGIRQQNKTLITHDKWRHLLVVGGSKCKSNFYSSRATFLT